MEQEIRKIRGKGITVPDLLYTPEEQAAILRIKALASALALEAERLNQALLARLKGVAGSHTLQDALEVGFTRLQLPLY